MDVTTIREQFFYCKNNVADICNFKIMRNERNNCYLKLIAIFIYNES